MKLSTISLALSAVLATAAALGIDDLPECAVRLSIPALLGQRAAGCPANHGC